MLFYKLHDPSLETALPNYKKIACWIVRQVEKITAYKSDILVHIVLLRKQFGYYFQIFFEFGT